MTPAFDVAGKRLVVLTPLAHGVDRRDMERTVATLADEQDRIERAPDMLVGGV